MPEDTASVEAGFSANVVRHPDKAAFEAHLKTPHFLAFKPKLEAWLEVNKVRFFSRLDP